MQRSIRSARPRTGSTELVDTAVDYLAYIGTLSVAVVIAVGALTFAGKQSLHWVDSAMQPSFFEQTDKRQIVNEPMDSSRKSLAMLDQTSADR